MWRAVATIELFLANDRSETSFEPGRSVRSGDGLGERCSAGKSMVSREHPNAEAGGQLDVQGVEQTEVTPARPGPGQQAGQIVAGDRERGQVGQTGVHVAGRQLTGSL